MKVVSIRYWETSRGFVGYEAVTDFGGTIWNDGMGGDTYLKPTVKEDMLTNGQVHDLLPVKREQGMVYENYLESLIDEYEYENQRLSMGNL